MSKRPDFKVRAMSRFLAFCSFLRVSDEQRANGTQMVNYVQSELVKRGIDVPASLVRRVGDFNDAAETLVRDLLAKEEL